MVKRSFPDPEEQEVEDDKRKLTFWRSFLLNLESLPFSWTGGGSLGRHGNNCTCGDSLPGHENRIPWAFGWCVESLQDMDSDSKGFLPLVLLLLGGLYPPPPLPLPALGAHSVCWIHSLPSLFLHSHIISFFSHSVGGRKLGSQRNIVCTRSVYVRVFLCVRSTKIQVAQG